MHMWENHMHTGEVQTKNWNSDIWVREESLNHWNIHVLQNYPLNVIDPMLFREIRIKWLLGMKKKKKNQNIIKSMYNWTLMGLKHKLDSGPISDLGHKFGFETGLLGLLDSPNSQLSYLGLSRFKQNRSPLTTLA